MQPTLRITEIFHSIQGEGLFTGLPTAFVRLTGCPLRCQYCDSEYAFSGGQNRSLPEILDEVRETQARYVCVTGGEPLAQPNCLSLLTSLCDNNLSVSLETSGALSVSGVDPRVSIVLDIKTPDSGECDKNDYSNLSLVKPTDQIKFVICSEQDYQWAKFKLDELHMVETGAAILFSPSYQQVSSKALAEWIIDDNLPVRFQVQVHKFLWGDVEGR